MNVDIRETTEQQRKSRRGLERSARSVERYGMQVQRRSVMEGMTIKRGSDTFKVHEGEPVLVITEAPEEKHAFEIQVLGAEGLVWHSTGMRGNRAEDLKVIAERMARSANKPAVRVIRPNGTRAVHCFNFKKRS
jgi:hypothetical protein